MRHRGRLGHVDLGRLVRRGGGGGGGRSATALLHGELRMLEVAQEAILHVEQVLQVHDPVVVLGRVLALTGESPVALGRLVDERERE